MIAQIQGTLIDIHKDRLWVSPGNGQTGLTCEVLAPAYLCVRLAPMLGKPVALYTLCYLESQNQGASFLPRLAGFLAPQDIAFFELLTSVKGIGNRKALRAMVLDTATLANAIADRDAKLLQTMPEVGKKLAETIIVTLQDKVDRFVSATLHTPGSAQPTNTDVAPTSRTLAREVLEVLLQLGEQRTDAVQFVDRVMNSKEPPTDVQSALEAVYRLKAQS